MGKIGEAVKCANEGCNNIFIRKTSSAKYCSEECKRDAINRKRREERHGKSNFTPGVSHCAYCGKEFWQKFKNNIYCCDKCCRRALRERDKKIKLTAKKSIRKVSANTQEKNTKNTVPKIMPKALFVRKLSNDLFWTHKY